MRYRKFTKKLKALGCHEIVKKKRKRGSHRKWVNPAAKGFASIPDHPGKDISDGTLRAIVGYLKIDWKDFNNA